MTPQATLEVNAQYNWASDLEYGQDSSGGSGPYSDSETGSAIGNYISGSYPSDALPHGGTAAEDWSISALDQHFDMSAFPSGYGNEDPMIMADDGYSQVTVSVQAIDTDYITNTGAAPVTVLFSYSLDAVVSGDLEEAECDWQVVPYPDTGGTNPGQTGTINLVPTNGAGSGSYESTIAPGATVGWYANYTFEGYASWGYDQYTGFSGAPFSENASSTGIIHADELDGKGNPVPGNPDLTFASGLDYSTPPACFAAGTRIAVPGGMVAVERLLVGGRVLTQSGGIATVVWTGHREVDCRRHARPSEVWPIRVDAGAFGPGVPGCAVLLSPDHAVFVDQVLIPVRYLVNGRTVARVAVDRVSYWHVELARHDVLLAEGLPCESFLDTGNRGAFDDGAVAGPRWWPGPAGRDALTGRQGSPSHAGQHGASSYSG